MTDTATTRRTQLAAARRANALVEERQQRIAEDLPAVAAEVFAYWLDSIEPAAVIELHRRLVASGDINAALAEPLLVAWLDDLADDGAA